MKTKQLFLILMILAFAIAAYASGEAGLILISMFRQVM